MNARKGLTIVLYFTLDTDDVTGALSVEQAIINAYEDTRVNGVTVVAVAGGWPIEEATLTPNIRGGIDID